jgi:hypothetical protein
LIVTYDEDDFTSTNKIATVFYGANVAVGIYSQTINHYNVLRTIEEASRLTTHAGAAASATPIGYCWTASARSVNALVSSPQKEEITAEKNIYISPNPANNKINVVLKNMITKRDINWEISSITGVRFKTGNVTNVKDGKIEIAIDNLKNGIYLVRVSDGVNVRLSRFVIAR